ncbi:hypothetical protein Goari_020473, partial [Gossypium aridum]|nr:hypothetical protein [Gossypium aridum]
MPLTLRSHLVGGIGMHSPYSAGPPTNRRLVACNAITGNFYFFFHRFLLLLPSFSYFVARAGHLQQRYEAGFCLVA